MEAPESNKFENKYILKKKAQTKRLSIRGKIKKKPQHKQIVIDSNWKQFEFVKIYENNNNMACRSDCLFGWLFLFKLKKHLLDLILNQIFSRLTFTSMSILIVIDMFSYLN